MKTIMVIKDEQAIDEWNRTIAQFIDVDNKIYKAEFIKVPESWEELKELCKSIKGNKKDLGGAMWFEFPIPKDSKLWLGKFLCIDEKGQIGIAEKTFGNDISIAIFADSLTPARQYQIIKSLIDKNWRANK